MDDNFDWYLEGYEALAKVRNKKPHMNTEGAMTPATLEIVLDVLDTRKRQLESNLDSNRRCFREKTIREFLNMELENVNGAIKELTTKLKNRKAHEIAIAMAVTDMRGPQTNR